MYPNFQETGSTTDLNDAIYDEKIDQELGRIEELIDERNTSGESCGDLLLKKAGLYYQRRDFNSSLKILEIEREKAKRRKMATQFNGKNKNNTPKKKGSGSDLGLPSEKSQKKGRAIDIVAKELKMAPKTIRKFEKITIEAKKDPKVKEKMEQALQGEIPLEAPYREIKPKEKDKRKEKNCKH